MVKSRKKKLAIYGTGGSGRELYEMITSVQVLCERWEELLFIDDAKTVGVFRDCRVMPFDCFSGSFSPDQAEVAIAVGEPSTRQYLADRVRLAGYALATICHPDAFLSPSSSIGAGVIIKSHVIVSADAEVRDNTWIQDYAIIGHDVEIGENCQISSFVATGGNAKVGNGTYIGLSACLREGITVGDKAVISMGAVVQKDVRPGLVVMGNPAREIAKNTGVFKSGKKREGENE